MPRRLIVVALACVVASCGGEKRSPTSPSGNTATTTVATTTTTAATTSVPAIARVTVAGVLTNANTRQPVGGGTVTAVNAATQTNASSGTDGNGYYSLAGVGTGSVTLTYAAPRYTTRSVSATISGDTRRDETLVPFFSRTGTGDTVFDIPPITRIRIIGTFTGGGSNFIVRIGGRLIVNEIIGTRYPSTRHEGVYLSSGGVTEITNSSGVVWEFSQEQ